MTVKFSQIGIGALFEFRGRRYRKVALSMAHDEERCGNIFQDHTDVVPETIQLARELERPLPTRDASRTRWPQPCPAKQ